MKNFIPRQLFMRKRKWEDILKKYTFNIQSGVYQNFDRC